MAKPRLNSASLSAKRAGCNAPVSTMVFPWMPCSSRAGSTRPGHSQAVLAQQLDEGHFTDDPGVLENLAPHGRADFVAALRIEVDFVDRAAGCIYRESQGAIIGCPLKNRAHPEFSLINESLKTIAELA